MIPDRPAAVNNASPPRASIQVGLITSISASRCRRQAFISALLGSLPNDEHLVTEVIATACGSMPAPARYSNSSARLRGPRGKRVSTSRSAFSLPSAVMQLSRPSADSAQSVQPIGSRTLSRTTGFINETFIRLSCHLKRRVVFPDTEYFDTRFNQQLEAFTQTVVLLEPDT